jgi:hypothetical protein
LDTAHGDGRTDTCDALHHSFLRYKSNISISTVQQNCIPQALLGVDVLCQAKSGLGKTAVFVLTTLNQLETIVDGECLVLVMCHTRELAYQIKNEYARFSKYLPNVKTGVFYGGTPIQKDIEVIKNKETCPNIIVGTPGRLNALVRDNILNLRSIKSFVLDECDKMLDQIGKLHTWITYPSLTIRRHAPRRPRDLPSHSYQQASDDVQRHPLTGDSTHLQEIHEKSSRNLCR